MTTKVNLQLRNYIESNILPRYEKDKSGHGLCHIKYVIDRSFVLVKENGLNVNPDMVYTIAAYHDIGHQIDPARHEILSAEIMLNDKKLKEFFTDEQMLTMRGAIEDHRASAKKDPRTIYGKIVSSADRNDSVEKCLERSYFYGKKLYPNATDEELYEHAFEVLSKKFGKGGYAKFYFRDNVYEDFLSEMRKLLEDKNKFIKAQKSYIDKLKRQ